MVNTKTMGHVFRHPKYYKQLKDKLPRGNLSTDSEEKRQASSDKRQAATIDHINKKDKNE